MPEVDIAELTKPFPPEALEKREGGRGKFFTYLKTHAVINRLNRACRYQWDWRIIDQHMEADVLVCRGELTIPGLGTKAGVGVQEIRPGGGVDLMKGASSDAMKKAATMFGVGIELYGDDVEDPDYAPRPYRAPPQAGRAPVTTPSARFTDNRAADNRTTDSRPAYAPRPQAPRPAASIEADPFADN